MVSVNLVSPVPVRATNGLRSTTSASRDSEFHPRKAATGQCQYHGIAGHNLLSHNRRGSTNALIGKHDEWGYAFGFAWIPSARTGFRA
jgi:hypothetical protein